MSKGRKPIVKPNYVMAPKPNEFERISDAMQIEVEWNDENGKRHKSKVILAVGKNQLKAISTQ